MDGSVQEFDDLLGLVSDSRITTYATMASLALLFYDYSLTIEQEINLVWKSRFSWGKVLFLVVCFAFLPLISICIIDNSMISYVTPVFLHTYSTHQFISIIPQVLNCLMALQFQTASSNIILWLVELTLAIRVWLLYSRSKAILFILAILYTCSITGVTVISATALFHKGVIPRPGPFLPGCYTQLPSFFYNVVVVPIVTTTVLLILTVYKTVQTMNGLLSYQKPQMLTLLLRDGVLYFSSVIVVLIVNLLVFHFARPTMATFAAGFIVAVPYVAGSRLFLNVREKLLYPNISTSNTLSTFELRPYWDNTDRFELDIVFADNTNAHPDTNLSVTDVEPDSAATLVPHEHPPWA